MEDYSATTRKLLFVTILTMLTIFSGCSTQQPISHDADYDVVVIGAGLGGLSAGLDLALNSMKVLVLEQHDKVGGCATSFDREDFTFEASLHQMAGGGPGKMDRGLYELLDHWGILQKVEFIELPELYRSIYPGVDIRLPNNWEGFKSALKKKWPEEAEGIDKFHRVCADTLDDLMSLKDLFRYRGAKAILTKAMVPLKQRTFNKYRKKTLQDVLDECFKNEDIKAVVSQLWVYYGAPVPDQTALLTLAATEVFLTDGVWHFKGTSQALSNAYAERIRELGGEVKTNTLVKKIVMQDGIARAVETATGQSFTCRYVMANTDPYQLTFKLIGETHFPKKYVDHLKKLKPANSLFGVYLGMNVDLHALGYHDTEIFYNTTRDSVVMHDNMMKGDFKNGCVAITIYSNYGDPTYAPEGKSLVTLTAYSDYKLWPENQEDYYQLKDQKVDELVDLAANIIPELADPEVVEIKEGYTPRTLKRFTMNKGGIVYGFYMSPEQWQKIPNHTPIPNVYIASNWTQTWHGMASAQVNGWCASRLILDREGIE